MKFFAALFLSGLYQNREIKVLQETLIRSRAGLSSYFYRKLPEHREIKSREIWPLWVREIEVSRKFYVVRYRVYT